MGRLPTTVNFPSLEELLERRRTPEEYWGEYINAVQYWIERLVARTNDELVENFGTQTIDLLFILSGTNAGLQINSSLTKITKIISGVVSIDLPSMLANSQAQATVTFTGVVVNKTMVVVNSDDASDPEAGLSIGGAWASETDTVKIRFFNVGGGTINPLARNYRITAYIFA